MLDREKWDLWRDGLDLAKIFLKMFLQSLVIYMKNIVSHFDTDLKFLSP